MLKTQTMQRKKVLSRINFTSLGKITNLFFILLWGFKQNIKQALGIFWEASVVRKTDWKFQKQVS